ncbi:MAG: hypothetical protein KAQ92_01500 [Candidatus Aenigmarchaeota archaeon]|nr:hypothetical protein [Candidatus Aenigmarchaeota archaeon]
MLNKIPQQSLAFNGWMEVNNGRSPRTINSNMVGIIESVDSEDEKNGYKVCLRGNTGANPILGYLPLSIEEAQDLIDTNNRK